MPLTPCSTAPTEDPPVPDWAALSLPDTWPDRLSLRRPHHLWRLLRHAAGLQRSAVQLPEGVPGQERIPRYILQEFHNLPNGNYSRTLTRGYITGFNRVMLGEIQRSHQRMARQLQHCRRVLDAGCGGGALAGRLLAAGVPDVWGLDPSPYLLKHAAQDWPGVRFVQGVAEATGFPDQRFDGIGACFLLHEIPPRYLERSLAEFARILKPGGLLSISEPSPLQLREPARVLLRRWGWRGLYFRALARRVHEPFLQAWHRQDIPVLMARHGFEVLEDTVALPIRHILVRKRPSGV